MCSVGRSKEHVVFSFREPETEFKLSGHARRVEPPGLSSLGPERDWGHGGTPH